MSLIQEGQGGPCQGLHRWLQRPTTLCPARHLLLCRACSLAGCLPEEAVHVGDSLLAGAPPAAVVRMQACCGVPACRGLHQATAAQEAVFTTRCAADVNGALRAGLAAAVWINRNGERPVPTGLHPAAILSSVLELPSALEQLQLLPQRGA